VSVRKPGCRPAAIAWLLFVLVGIPHACGAGDPLVVEVVGVADGDSLVVIMAGARTQVRLAEIDAPERGQPWNRRAREALRDKVLDQRVRLKVVDTDRYGRTVAEVWLGERHINREMVREGHAWVYTQYLRDQTLRVDETRAREAGLGLWSMADPVEPRQWRRRRAGSRS